MSEANLPISTYELKLSASDEKRLFQKEILIGDRRVKLKDIEEFSKLIQMQNIKETLKQEPDDFDMVKHEQDDSSSSSVEVSVEPTFIEDDKAVVITEINPSEQGYRPRRKSNYRPRRVSSSLDRPFKCIECPSSFASKGNLKFHMKTVHEKQTVYACPKCDSVFSQKGNLKTHYNSIHLHMRPFECLLCEAMFSQKGNLKTHLNKMHCSSALDAPLLSKCPPPKKRGRPPTISSK